MNDRDSPQKSVRATYMRGGTSRALIFHDRDLPPPGPDGDTAVRDKLFLAALGSPDPHERQLDGMGGGISSLSKVAIVSPSARADADVDYVFAQVSVTGRHVSYRGNCGNISSAIGPFAVDEGLVACDGDNATVRIHNVNTGKIIRATFPLVGGRAAVAGDCAIAGVAGTGAPIRLDFLDPGGAVTGRLLPTGALRDPIDIDRQLVEVSLVDASNPVVFAAATSFGLTGSEQPTQLAADKGLLARLEKLRIAAALLMGVSRSEEEARTIHASMPLVALVSRSQAGGDIAVRMVSSGQPHRATPLTGALCLAVATRIDGTVVSQVARPRVGDEVVIEHPAGALTVATDVEGEGAAVLVRSAAFLRTARRLMEGQVFYR